MTRVVSAILSFMLLLALALAAAFIWREAVVETAAKAYLARLGLPDARFTVAAIGRSQADVEGVSFGDGALRIRRLRLAYDLPNLAEGRLREARIEGLAFDARSDLLARLQALSSDEGDGAAAVSKVILEDASILLAEPVAGEIGVEGKIDLSGDALGAALEIAIALDRGGGTFTIDSEDLAEGGAVRIAGEGEADLAGLAWPGLPDLAAARGLARFSVTGTASIPAVDAASPEAWLTAGISLAGNLRLDGVAAAAGPEIASAAIPWRLEGEDGRLAIDLTGPAAAEILKLPPDLLLRAGLPEAWSEQTLALEVEAGRVASWSWTEAGGRAALTLAAAARIGDATADLRAEAEAAHDATLRPTGPAAFSVSIEAREFPVAAAGAASVVESFSWIGEGQIALDGAAELSGPLIFTAREVRHAEFSASTAMLVVDFQATRGARGDWSISAASGAEATFRDAKSHGRAALSDPLAVSLERLEARVDADGARLDLAGSLAPVSGALLGDGVDIAFAGAGGRFAADIDFGETIGGAVRLEDAALTLPGEAIAVSGLSAAAPLSGAAPASVTLSARIEDTGRRARFAPLRVALEGERDGDRLVVSGAAETLNGAVRLPVEGEADLAALTGRLSAGPARLEFRRDGLQPGVLSPQFAALRNAQGVLHVRGAEARLADGAVATSARLTFENLSARLDDVSFVGLSGDLRLSQLAPLATAGEQRLTAREVVAGAPVRNVALRFSIPPRARGLTVRLHEVRGEVAEGEVLVRDATWNSLAEVNPLSVELRDISIAALLREWKVEGVSGTGRLTGVVPVRAGRAGVAVDHGEVASEGAGVIRVDWGAARERLVNSGEQVSLAVNALEDFRYNALTIGLDQPAGGGLTIAIGLDGSNPEVLDGYPFRFNVTLSGDLGELLAAVREGRRIGGDLLQGGLGGG